MQLAVNEDYSSILKKRKLKFQEVKNVGGHLFCAICIASHTLTTLLRRAREYSLHKTTEFQCEVLTGLLEKLFLVVFFKQEMTVEQAAMELRSLILMGEKGIPA